MKTAMRSMKWKKKPLMDLPMTETTPEVEFDHAA